MRKLLVALMAGLFATVAAASTATDCDAKATEKKLHGAAKTSFIGKCMKDTKVASVKTAVSDAEKKCEDKAAEKKLAGAAKTAFVKKCVKDAAVKPAQGCDAQATEKKLHGAAKASFLKKCMKDSQKASAAASASAK